MVDDLAERLRSHEDAFQSLLSLIPSKLYYAQEAQTQWKKRKQTPEQKQQAKRAKLDPDQTNSAARRPDPHVESTMIEDGENSGLTKSQIKNRAKKAKKLRALENTKKEDDEEEAVTEDRTKASPTKDQPINGTAVQESALKESTERVSLKSTKLAPPKVPSTKPNGTPSAAPKSPTVNGTPLPSTPRILTNGIKSSPSPSITSTIRSPSVPIISSPIPEQQSSPSSIAELRAKLAARISQSRVARKAIGTSVPGAPQTREAILEARAKRKAIVDAKINAKKEAKKLLQATPSVPEIKEESSEDEMVVDSGLSFGRVLVNDTEIDAGRGQVKLSKQKAKGTSDPKSRLEHLKARAEKFAQMDPEIADKAMENDRWHHALLSARGEKVKDDVSLLKRTISRREREKKKSKREWDDRIAKVEKGKEDRQRKREGNIAKRREEKGKGKGKGKSGGKKVVKPKKKGFMVKKKRPGFEGGRIKVRSK